MPENTEPLRRFFVPEAAGETGIFSLKNPELAHRIGTVLRKKVGQKIAIFPGDGTESECEICSLDRRRVELKILGPRTPVPEFSRAILAFSPLGKDRRIKFLLEKGTELGATDFLPVRTARTEGKLEKIPALEAVVAEAAEQSGRARAPRILPEISFEKWLRAVESGDFFPAEKWRIAAIGADPAPAPGGGEFGILVGPEGGFVPGEVAAARAAGVRAAGLGGTVLRAETAAAVGFAAVRG